MKKVLCITILLISYSSVFAQEVIHLAFYNVLNYPQAPPTDREQILSEILEELNPDIFMICELESGAGGEDILNNSLNAFNDVYTSAPYQNNTSSTADLQQLLYYNRNKFTLDATDIIQTSIRDINRYRLKLKTVNETTNPQYLEVFVAHLKASQGGQNELLRLDMVEAFTDYLSTLDPNDPVIFAGDLNLYTSDEPAYQELLNSSNPIVIKDPIDSPGDWNNNPSFEFLHTQSTRISNAEFNDFGAGGGLDSRFDFILMSENLLDPTADLRYIDDTYEAFGNNSNCYNNRIDNTNCGGTFSQNTRDLLYQMSDHLPVIAQLETTAQFLSTTEVIKEQGFWFVSSNVASTMVEIAFAKAQSTQPFPVFIVLYDQTGRQLKKFAVTDTRMKITIDELAEGVYYLRPEGIDSVTLKFIKTH
jgi:endonuclease/exonuclease/phosphatase family metal-dependent hydrolase